MRMILRKQIKNERDKKWRERMSKSEDLPRRFYRNSRNQKRKMKGRVFH